MKLWGLCLFLFTSIQPLKAYEVGESTLTGKLRLENTLTEYNAIQGEIGLPLSAECGGNLPKLCDEPVHVTPWCKKQYEILKEKAGAKSQFQDHQGPSVTFLAEEHGDEQAYNFYEKLVGSGKYDCLFIELPHVFNKNFDSKKGIVHDSGKLEALSRRKDPKNITSVKLKSLTYIELLDSLSQVARENDVDIVLVDSSEKKTFQKDNKYALKERNEAMAENIYKTFEKGSCKKGLSIKGAQHLFGESSSRGVRPIDEILKSRARGKIKVTKAMVYSPTSEVFKEGMGPCSWINALPLKNEIYFDKEFFSSQSVFPERLEEGLLEQKLSPVDSADYAIFLPLSLNSHFMKKKLNEGKEPPRRFKLKKEMERTSLEVPLSLRSNSATLGISFGQESLSSQCYDYCSQHDLKNDLIIKDIEHLEPTIKCQPIHPSRAAGHSYVPKAMANIKVVADCFCKKR